MDTVIIPIEVKHRELDSKLCLAHKIASKKKFKIIISAQRSLGQISFENCIFFDKSISNAKIDYIKKIKEKNLYLYIDEEGPYSLLDKFALKVRTPKQIINNLSVLLLHGDEDKKYLKHKNNLIIGNPKYDLLSKTQSKIFIDEINFIKKKFKKFVFVPSNFGLDSLRKPSAQDKFMNKNYIFSYNERKLYETFKKKREGNIVNYQYFIKIINEIAAKNKDILFIIRPHPYQDFNLFSKRFSNLKNIKVIYKFSIIPWIIACTYYIHAGCLSVFDAVKLQKPIYYINKKKIIKKHKIFKNIGKNLDLRNNKLFSNSELKKFKKENKKNTKFLKQFIQNISDQKFFNSFNNYIQLYYNPSRPSIIKLREVKKRGVLGIVKSKLKKIFSDQYFTEKYQNQKIKKITLFEIQKKIKIWNDLQKEKVKVKKLQNNIFQIY